MSDEKFTPEFIKAQWEIINNDRVGSREYDYQALINYPVALMEIERLTAALAAELKLSWTLVEALMKQSKPRSDGYLCFCDPADYDQMIVTYGSDRVEHSQYCKCGNAALAAYRAAREAK